MKACRFPKRTYRSGCSDFHRRKALLRAFADWYTYPSWDYKCPRSGKDQSPRIAPDWHQYIIPQCMYPFSYKHSHRHTAHLQVFPDWNTIQLPDCKCQHRDKRQAWGTIQDSSQHRPQHYTNPLVYTHCHHRTHCRKAIGKSHCSSSQPIRSKHHRLQHYTRHCNKLHRRRIPNCNLPQLHKSLPMILQSSNYQ